MKNVKHFVQRIVLAAIVAIVASLTLTGCGHSYEDGYRAGLRHAAEYFDADEFDLEAWATSHGGKDVSFFEADSETGRSATASWWCDRYRVEIGLADGEVTIIERRPFTLGPFEIGFISGGEKQSDHWWSPQLSKEMCFIPNGKGYAVSISIRDICEKALETVNNHLAVD